MHQLHDGLLSQDALPYLLNDKSLNPGGVQVAGAARPRSFGEQGSTDVIGELAALGSLGAIGPAADTTLEQPAQEIRTPHPRGPLHLRGALPHRLLHVLEQFPGHQRGPRSLHPYRVLGFISLALSAPHCGAGVRLVAQHVVETPLVPALAPVGDAPVVQLLAYLLQAVALKRLLEYLLHYRSRGRVNLQGGALLRPIADLHLPEAEGGLGAQEEAPRSGLPHSPDDLLGKIFAVIFVHALDNPLKQPAGGVVLGLLGDGHHADALAPQLSLERYGVLPLAGESRKLPDKNHVKRSLGLGALLDHLPELGPVGDAAALGFVNVLPCHGVAVGLGVLLESPQLGGHRQVHVLPIAGHPGVERRRSERL